jgi:PPM family protein phosphatase
MKIDFAGRTDPGHVRARNEDALLQRPERGLFAVADGMGGHAGGDIASRIAVDVLDEHMAAAADDDPAGRLETAVRAAHDAILKAARADRALSGMGTTLTALRIHDGSQCTLAHVGDSRAYRLRAGSLDQLTRDQTWVQEQMDAGLLSAAQARNHPYASMLTCALGIEEADLDVQILEWTARDGDLILLCTDGLVARLDHADLRRGLDRHPDLEAAGDALVAAANAAGGPDNITLALVRFGSSQ